MVTVAFQGDNNEVLRLEQKRLYVALIPSLVLNARYKYIEACQFIGYRSEFLQKLVSKDAFDTSFYYQAYVIIANWYRWKHANWVTQLRLPYNDENVPEELGINHS